MRSFKAKAALMALSCALASSAIVVGCSSDSRSPSQKTAQGDENVGGIGLNLELAEGITVDTVHYVVTQGGVTVIEGDISVADAAATVSVLVGGLAPGSYEISLSATSTDGEVSCAGSAPFTISTGTTTNVTVDLTCDNEVTDGAVIAEGSISECNLDVIDYYTAAPLVTSTSGSIALTSQAQDVDGAQPDYAWTSTGGTIVPAPGGEAILNCNGDAGVHTVTLTVSTEVNSNIPGQDPVPCEQVVSFQVECVALSCGNGVVDAAEGETCDTALDPSCPADCTSPVCGDGDMEGSEVCDDGNTFNNDNCPNDCTPAACGDSVVEGAEDCDPPLAGVCDASCQEIPAAVCGNGVVEFGEDCEPPNTASCDSLCQEIVPAVCGDGIISAPETCEPGQSGNCDGECQDAASATCYSCQSTNPNTSLFISPDHICNFWSDSDMPTGGPALGSGLSRRDLCWALHSCVYATECAENGTSKCYLGSNPTSPNGDCKAEVEAACESTDPGTVGGRFSNYTYGCAGALDLADQTRLNCSSECFVDPSLPVNQ